MAVKPAFARRNACGIKRRSMREFISTSEFATTHFWRMTFVINSTY